MNNQEKSYMLARLECLEISERVFSENINKRNIYINNPFKENQISPNSLRRAKELIVLFEKKYRDVVSEKEDIFFELLTAGVECAYIGRCVEDKKYLKYAINEIYVNWTGCRYSSYLAQCQECCINKMKEMYFDSIGIKKESGNSFFTIDVLKVKNHYKNSSLSAACNITEIWHRSYGDVLTFEKEWV
ncbi:MAG: hypothetical protein RSE00_02440 [Clostridia bacterium]